MRIGIDCDGVLRDFIPDVINKIKETNPEHTDKILVPESWDWETWLPFWTEDETEKYVFEDNYLGYFGPVANPIKSAVEDFVKRKNKTNNFNVIFITCFQQVLIHHLRIWRENIWYLDQNPHKILKTPKPTKVELC